MHTFRRQTLLAASPEQVFAFHENPHNIRKISPFFLQIIQVDAHTEAVQDDRFALKLHIFGFPLKWNGVWNEVDKPTLLVDTATPFPFKYWRHEHRFDPKNNGTWMTDIVTYRITGGWLGRLFGATLFRLQLILMFAGRHRATREYFAHLRHFK